MNKLQAEITNYSSDALIALLTEIDAQLKAAREIANRTGFWAEAMAILDVRLAIIDQMDQISETLFNNYIEAK